MTDRTHTEAVETVALAICEAEGTIWSHLSEYGQMLYLRMATAAIEAHTAALAAALDLSGLTDEIRKDIKQARADGDQERRSYLRGELQGVLQAYAVISNALGVTVPDSGGEQ